MTIEDLPDLDCFGGHINVGPDDKESSSELLDEVDKLSDWLTWRLGLRHFLPKIKEKK